MYTAIFVYGSMVDNILRTGMHVNILIKRGPCLYKLVFFLAVYYILIGGGAGLAVFLIICTVGTIFCM